MQSYQIQQQSDAYVDKLYPLVKLFEQYYQTHPFTFNELEQGELFILEDFIPPSLCQKWIELAEILKFEAALLTTGLNTGVLDTSVRDSSRVMIDDQKSAEIFFNALKSYTPLCVEGAYLYKMNERFRVLKYEQGQQFKEHYDGRFPYDKNVFSMVTIHFYLNTVQKGGGTRFFEDTWEKGYKDVDSVEGKLAIFRQQGWLHRGSSVEEGVKYSVRNDLLYKWMDNLEADSVIGIEKCGVCKQMVQGIELESCKHKLLKCGCPPFNKFIKSFKLRTCNLCGKSIKIKQSDNKYCQIY